MKILYLNHVCWDWIFQRPQILALKLEQDFECVVVNKKYIMGKRVVSKNPKPHKKIAVIQLPKEEKCKLIKIINELIYFFYIRVQSKVDVIWICHPSLYKFVPPKYNGIIIYDCMDNHIAMSSNNNKKKNEILEAELVKRSDLIFVSSKFLKSKINNKSKVFLVRNSFWGNIENEVCFEPKKKSKYTIGYIGTISNWFDFELIVKSTERLVDIEYHLVGPWEKNCPKVTAGCNSILWDGVVEHQNIRNVIRSFDAMMMPFILCDIVLSVDPVKMYEYINFGKCIISVYYPELEYFSDFVYFYHSNEEYFDLIEYLKARCFSPKYSNEQRIAFLKQNTWDERYKIIFNQINELTKRNGEIHQ